MTTIYFIRHAQSNRFEKDDRNRPLTEEGMADTLKITEKLKKSGISHIVSSPYLRTIQTVADLSETLGIEIETEEDLRERNAGKWHGENFFVFIEQQWADFNYHILDGECLADVQKRNIFVLEHILEKYKGEVIGIATHGTALSTIINFYYPEFNFQSFKRIVDYMPYVVRMDFEGKNCVAFEEILIVEKEYK